MLPGMAIGNSDSRGTLYVTPAGGAVCRMNAAAPLGSFVGAGLQLATALATI